MIGYLFDYYHYLNLLVTFMIKKKIKNTDIFSFGSLSLRHKWKCDYVKSICMDFMCVLGREFACWLAFDKEKWAAPASRTKMHCSQSKPRNREFVIKLKKIKIISNTTICLG